MKNERFYLSKRVRSFGYAIKGLILLFREEHNFRIHISAAILVVIIGFILRINSIEWLAVIFAIGIVLITEILNTAIENMADLITLEKDERIRKIKDLGAAAALISAFIAAIIGIIIFLPKIISII